MIHFFQPSIAKAYGIEESILFEYISSCCLENKKNNHNFFDGRHWVCNSVNEVACMFPYMTPSKITRSLKKLEDAGLVVSGHHDQDKWNRTKWYAVTRKGLNLYLHGQFYDTDMYGGKQ